MKNPKGKIQRRIEINEETSNQILCFLKGEDTTRGLGKKLGYTPQGVINLANSIVRQWVQEGHLIFYTNGKIKNL